jgi:hypothetical protein
MWNRDGTVPLDDGTPSVASGTLPTVSEPLWESIEGLDKLTKKEIAGKHDYAIGAGHQSPIKAEFYRAEYARKESRSRERWMIFMTLVITIATVINVTVFVWDALA